MPYISLLIRSLTNLLEKLCPGYPDKMVFIEPKDAKDAGNALKEFVALPSQKQSGVIFAVCGGKWSEGLDYRGDMLSGAMVIGFPLAPFNRPQENDDRLFSA